MAGEYIFRILGAERNVSGAGLVRFASNEVMTGRCEPAAIIDFFESGVIEKVDASLELDRKHSLDVIEGGKSEAMGLRLWRIQRELSEKLAGTDDLARRRFQRIISLLARLPGNKIPRVEEEWQIWVGPEVHWLLANDFPADSESWTSLVEELNANFSKEQKRGVAQLFRSLLGFGAGASTASGRKPAALDRPLTLSWGKMGDASEPFQYSLASLKTVLGKPNATDWQTAWIAALERHGDVHASKQDTLQTLAGAISDRGLETVREEIEQAEEAVVARLDTASAALWTQLLGQLRAACGRITIGQCWIVDASLLGRRSMAAIADTIDSRDGVRMLTEAVIDNVRHMGETLISQPPSLVALEMPRYWLKTILPFSGGDADLPLRLTAALAKETCERVPEECQPTVVEWMDHLGQAASKLSTCLPFSEEVLRCPQHLFTEDKATEAEWRSVLGGMVVAAVIGKEWRGGRSELCEALVQASPQLSRLTPDRWKASSAALLKRVRDVLDETFLPELIACQADVTKTLGLNSQINNMEAVESDVYGWCRLRTGYGQYRLWLHSIFAASSSFGLAHQAFIEVSQLAEWPLPDKAAARFQVNQLTAALNAAAGADPNMVRSGLLKRSAPRVSDRDLIQVRADARDYALAVARSDEYGQRKAIAQLCATALADWSLDSVERFAQMIDSPVRQQLSTQAEAENKRTESVAQGWFAAKLSTEGHQWAAESMEQGSRRSSSSQTDAQASAALDSLVLLQVLTGLCLRGRLLSAKDGGAARFGQVAVSGAGDPELVGNLQKLLHSHCPKSIRPSCEAAIADLMKPSRTGFDDA
jgi:hypothetical protein